MIDSPEPNREGRGSEIVVFILNKDSRCAECGREVVKGNFLRLEADKPLCLDCADLGHLEFLPRGDRQLAREQVRTRIDRMLADWEHGGGA